MIIISDTSPLHYLVLIEVDHVLPALFHEVVIPAIVYEELQQAGTPDRVRRWVAHAPAWLRIASPARMERFDLDPGETAAICLAREMNADRLLVDDRKARLVARKLGIETAGTLGVLRVAADQRLIVLETALQKLRQTNFRISEQTIREVLDNLNREAE